MPELPEVETIKRQLNRLIVGKEFGEVKIFSPKVSNFSENKFREIAVGAEIIKISRRAKILIIGLDNGWTMLVHLKMTGQLIYRPSARNSRLPENKHARAAFYFIGGSELLFNDSRKFGYIKLLKAKNLENFWAERKFGPEALDKKFDAGKLKKIFVVRPKMKIKQFLIDQKNIAGIGNIYSDEILFFAGVHPCRQAGSLSSAEIKKIFQGMKKILTLAIKLRGTSSSDYMDALGRKGRFASRLKVYGREGEKCVKCRETIKRIRINGRSACFCPTCQTDAAPI